MALDFPPFGTEIILSPKRGVIPNDFSAYCKLMFQTGLLSFIKLNWSGTYGTEDRPFEGYGTVEWIGHDRNICYSTPALSQHFQALAWQFEQRYAGLLHDFPESAVERPTSLVVVAPTATNTAPVMFYLEDDEDWYNLDDHFATDFRALFSRIHVVYFSQPNAHDVLEAYDKILAAWPELDELIKSGESQ